AVPARQCRLPGCPRCQPQIAARIFTEPDHLVERQAVARCVDPLRLRVRKLCQPLDTREAKQACGGRDPPLADAVLERDARGHHCGQARGKIWPDKSEPLPVELTDHQFAADHIKSARIILTDRSYPGVTES